ncbi:MAG TPA: DegT/DnrJ/EryC1/StrS family aminotransferase, partial [Magnetospirillaceae bacterium]|nr:DegT/DnrJ/EryC1/StrS family aminotransferase [Magnetospirillaceae bacterium]
GEGGIVTTQDEGLYRSLLQWRTHGISRDPKAFQNTDLAFDQNGNANPWYYEAQQLGFNYRASDINCALGLSQLAKLPRFAEQRRMLAAHYDRLLAPLAPIVRPVVKSAGCEPVLHLYVVLIDFAALGLSRSALMARLQAQGIGTQVHYIPVHKQPLYQDGQPSLPGAERYYQQCLSLPLFASMTADDVERVAAVLAETIRS